MRGTAGHVRTRVALCGLLVGVAGVVLFGTIHALVIVPIWTRLPRGLPYAVAVGVAVSWAYHEYRRARSDTGGLIDGLRFGVAMWLAGLPATVLAFGMRLQPFPGPIPWWVDVATILLAGIGGAALLGVLARAPRAAFAGAVALVLFLAYNGGPMPIEVRMRAVGLPLGYLLMAAIGGGMVGVLHARLVTPLLRMPGHANYAAPATHESPAG